RRRLMVRRSAKEIPDSRDLRLAWLSCLALNLKRTARLVSAAYDDAVRPSGLRSTQFSILATVAVNPDVSIAQLADWVDADRTTVQRSIGIMQRNLWITVEKAEQGNLRRLKLSAKGQKKLAEAYKLWEQAQKQMVDILGTEASRRLLHDLSRARKKTREKLVTQSESVASIS
ncbi:MAG TPA: MarR family winged helix-turn-helix transcriptional regulator, partial [Leptospiraceae bacterium]|nr:MarR family winged helix-turn-helix transcriptional regulator [Leptospiraceae bacterium]